MNALRRSDDFNADVRREWMFLHQFGEALADRFIDRVETSLRLLAQQPGLGHLGRYRHRRLAGLRLWSVAKPFSDWLIFYWDRPDYIHLFRLMHGARDLPRRLVEGENTEEAVAKKPDRLGRRMAAGEFSQEKCSWKKPLEKTAKNAKNTENAG